MLQYGSADVDSVQQAGLRALRVNLPGARYAAAVDAKAGYATKDGSEDDRGGDVITSLCSVCSVRNLAQRRARAR
ncbi:hypothetical protein AKJ09_04713 [Labilithrix luteola]|uniref:Uncharacterized protein n=1 Tax=Labilithrix luteola TaxID=1391654 RepID=A0A0K1PY24_9BACT|nr:hypothetical protein AKJ09_04713 [Labilithrix luteola]